MKKSNLFLSALFAMSILAVLAFSGCEEPDPEYTVKLEITGPANTTVEGIGYHIESYPNNFQNITIPWTKTIVVKGKKIITFDAVDFNNPNTYTCVIYVNGKEVARSSDKHHVSVFYNLRNY